METNTVKEETNGNNVLLANYINQRKSLLNDGDVDTIECECILFSELLEELYNISIHRSNQVLDDLQTLFSTYLTSTPHPSKTVIETYNTVLKLVVSIFVNSTVISNKSAEYQKLVELLNN